MTIEIGVLGHGFMGQAHSNAFERLPMFFPDGPEIHRKTLIGLEEELVAEAAERLGFAETATDWREVVDDVVVFYNLGPNHVHVEPSIAALEVGTPVFCEKPLAPTVDGAREMVDAAQSAGVPNGTAFGYRFVPAIQYAKRLIEAGELGEIHQFRGRYLQDWLVDPEAPWSWRLDADQAGAGALGDLGAHTIDLAHFLIGGIDRVSGHLETFVEERPIDDGDETRPVTVDDAFTAQIAFENGTIGTIEASRFASGHKNDHSITIHGSKGSLRFSLERLNELEILREGDRGYQTVLVTDEDDPYIEHWWPPGHGLGWEHAIVHENYEFLSAVAESGEFDPSFQAGYDAQQVIEAIAESDERNSWVAVE
jgi:predicted dehydrogenase